MLSVQGVAHADLSAPARYDGFLYVLGAVGDSAGPAEIEAYGRERVGGKLTYIGRLLTGGQSGALAGGQQHGLVANGRRVYAVNTTSNTVSVMAVGSDGRLSVLQQVNSGGTRPGAIAIRGNRLYVNHAGHLPDEPLAPSTVVGFTIRFDGTLAPLPCDPGVNTPGDGSNIASDLAINPEGTALMTAGLLTNKIDSYRIDAQGCLHKRQTVSADGGAFAVDFRPFTDFAVVTRAVPEVFGTARAPGIGSFKVSLDGSFTEVSSYVDPDKSDDGLRDPCWTSFAKDGVHMWIGSFIPRSINAFTLDNHGTLTRLSEHHPTDSIPDPSNPGAQLVIGAFDITTDSTKDHLYQIRGAGIDGNPDVPRSIHAFEATGNWSVDAGLREIQVVSLPTDTQTRGTPGLVFVAN